MKNGTSNARIGRLVFRAAVLSTAVCAAGCSTQISPQELLGMVPLNQKPEEPPPPVPPTAPQEPEKNSARIQAEQVDPSDQCSSLRQTGSHISQIPSSPDTDAVLQSAIDVDDPCLGDLQNSEQCRSSLKPKSASADAVGDSSMTLTVVAPGTGNKGTFDANRAVDEIGRGRTKSQGAQSAGSDFLSGATKPPADLAVPDQPVPGLPPGAVIIQPQ
ncbi:MULTISPECIES: hypothetical protein [Hyphomonas]|nr:MULTISPECIES: hypothetical protein [Hyphomonas]|tara:strand:+ start:4690 stop:5337 length:648 start_codon:yes stop_codon:yes gene_type:complete